MAIRKTVYQVVVLHESDNDIRELDLKEILENMDDGDCIGQVKYLGSTICPTADVAEVELKAIGNDGSFFDLDAEYP